MYETGDINAGTISVSQGTGLTKKIMPVKEIVLEMMEEATRIQVDLTRKGLI
jgi:hypothetical protein